MTTTPIARPRGVAAARRVGAVTAGVALAWLATSGAADAATLHVIDTAAGFKNPLEGVIPDFSLWGNSVGDTWRRLMGAFWAACLAICALWVIAAGAKWAGANRRGFAGQQVEAKQAFMDAATGLGACAAGSIIVGGVLFAVAG